MRGGIDAMRHAADDAQPGIAQRLGKRLGVVNSLRRGAATANDGQR